MAALNRERLSHVVLDQDTRAVHAEIEALRRIGWRVLPGEMHVAPRLLNQWELGFGGVEVRVAHELLNEEPEQALLAVVELRDGNALEAAQARLTPGPGHHVTRRTGADHRHLVLVRGQSSEQFARTCGILWQDLPACKCAIR